MAYIKEQAKPTIKKISVKAKGFKPNSEEILEKKCLMCYAKLRTYDLQLRGYCNSCNKLFLRD